MHLLDLHQALKELRVTEGFTQQQVADAIGITRTSITNIEQGRQPISIQHAINMLDHLGYEIELTIKKIK